MKKLIASMFALLLLFASAPAEALLTAEDVQALNGGAARMYETDGRLTFLDGSAAAGPIAGREDADRVLDALTGLLGGDARTHFEPWRTLRDASGNVYYVYQQIYADTLVQGGAVKIVTDAAGQMLGAVASLVSDLPDEAEGRGITAEEAEAAVRAREIKTRGSEPEILSACTRRVVLPVNREIDIEAEEELSRFVWAVYTVNPLSGASARAELPYLAHYVTMAGEYLYCLPTLLPADEAGTAGYDADYVFQFMEPVPYTGYVDLADGTEQEISVTLMRDTRTGMYYLGNIEHRMVVADCWEFLYNHGRVVLEYSPDNLEWDQVGLLSLYNYCRACDYYREIGWMSGDGEDTPVLILKDYCDRDHRPIDNAAYAGKYSGWQCFLSSAANTYSQALDVCAHEFTHCVTDSVTTYNAYWNDAGAINEAMSDIQGNLCEMLLGATEDKDWLLGENSGEAIRSMSDPGRYQQPAYSWDKYYQANVKTPTDINDRGGVHTNSSLLNSVAFRLCEDGGMPLADARAFWFAVDCAMVPGTDFAQLRRLLPWTLEITGLGAYREALDRAMNAVRLGVRALPETLPENRVLLTLTLPDNEVFGDGNWMLMLLTVNTEALSARVKWLADRIERGETEDFPVRLREMLESGEDMPWDVLAESVLEAVFPDEETPDAASDASDDPEAEELIRWLKENLVEDMFSTGSGSAGQDGRTVRVMSEPGRTVPCLLYLTLEPNSTQMRQMNLVIWLNHHWVDVTALLGLPRAEGFLERAEMLASFLFETDFVPDLLQIVFSCDTWEDWLEALTLDVPGGGVFAIPDTGLEKVSLTYNMAFDMDDTPEIVNRKSRPKLPDGAGQP